jgi:hypothetical protein
MSDMQILNYEGHGGMNAATQFGYNAWGAAERQATAAAIQAIQVV